MQLQIFNHKDLGQVRVIGDNENPLFCLRDICEVLGLESVNKVANAIKAEFEGGGGIRFRPFANQRRNTTSHLYCRATTLFCAYAK